MSRNQLHAGTMVHRVLAFLLLFAGASGAQEPVADIPSTHIQSLLREGVHPRLRWGSFADYQALLNRLYQQNGFNPLWFRDGRPSPQAAATVASLRGADARGLDSGDYDADLLGRWLKSPQLAGNPREIAAFDVGLSLSAMRYLSNLYIGRINPRLVDFGLSVEPKKVDLPNLIEQLSRSDNPKALVDGMEPKLPLYRNLKEALARYRALAKETQAPAVSFPAKFGPGGHHKDIPVLRRYLAVLGDLKEIPPGMAEVETYDPDLVAAVKSFQERHGLGPDGVIGKGTVAAISVPPAERVRQIQLALERLRWLPDGIQGPYLIVNIPSFQLFGSRDGEGFGQHDIQMNVIVGAAVNGRHTPVFHADMTYVTFNPYWNVPLKIAAKELAPALRRNPGYLARNNMEIVSGFGANAPAYAPTPENIEMLATGALKIRQRPGASNALGLVKFAFPNNNNIYLHSTPSKGLFQRARRDFSHGCIRVQEPVKLAEWVLAEQGEWTRERIESAMAGRTPRTVTLKQPIPVYIFYSTVLADRDGRASFYQDIYGHDRTLETLLAKGFPYPS